MTSLLANTSGAFFICLIVSAGTTRLAGKTGDAGNEFGGDADVTSPNKTENKLGTPSNVSWPENKDIELFAGPIQCNTSHCGGYPIVKRQLPGPEFSSTFTKASGRIDAKPKSKSFTFSLVMGCFAGVVSMVIIVGNTAIVGAIVMEPRLRYSTNYFLMSLAISDFYLGTFSIPLFTFYLINGYWALGSGLCDMWLTLNTICRLSSRYTIFTITLDRYLSITAPVMYRNWRTDKKIIWMILTVWGYSCITNFIGVLIFTPEGYVRHPLACSLPIANNPWLLFTLMLIWFWIPTILMCVFYYKIYKVASSIQKHASTSGRDSSNPHVRKSSVTYGRPATQQQTTNNSNVNQSWHNVCGYFSRRPDSDVDLANAGSMLSNEAASDYRRTLKLCEDCNTDTNMKDKNNSNECDSSYYGHSSSIMTDGTDIDRAGNTSTDRIAIIKGPHGLFVANETEEIDGSPIDPCAVHIFSQSADTPEVAKLSTSTAKFSISRDRKTFKTISLVLGVFLICYLPLNVMLLMPALCGRGCVNVVAFQMAYWLCYLNSAINPFVYAYANDKFRVTVTRMLKFRCTGASH